MVVSVAAERATYAARKRPDLVSDTTAGPTIGWSLEVADCPPAILPAALARPHYHLTLPGRCSPRSKTIRARPPLSWRASCCTGHGMQRAGDQRKTEQGVDMKRLSIGILT